MGNGFGVFETFLSQPLYVMVRFGMWDKALVEPKPSEQFRFKTGVWHYMRGMAYANIDNMKEARAELQALGRLRDDLTNAYVIGFQSAPTLLTIAESVLAGEIFANQGKLEDAVNKLARAVRLEDSLRYSEPPDWYFPTRHVLGAVLLQVGVPAEAASVYWQDLRKNPENAYSLLGLSQALEAQGDAVGAATMARRFKQAWAAADVELKTSRF
jgi:tetratricopeptide (TPR) repeat protein